MKLSAVIITFNEERNIRRCVESLRGVADEIVVVDSYSTDKTKAIAESLGARFIEHPFEGHIQQKNYALTCAQHDWILSLDADEALDASLQASIMEVKQSGIANGYSMNRLTNYCGHWVRHCGWYPDKKVRLIRSGKATWCGTNPHDRLDLHEEQKAVHLKGDILHYSYYTTEDHYKQIEYFGDIAARELFRQQKQVTMPVIFLKVIVQFIKSYFLKMGFLDGVTGLTISRLSAYATWRKYIKLKALYTNS